VMVPTTRPRKSRVVSTTQPHASCFFSFSLMYGEIALVRRPVSVPAHRLRIEHRRVDALDSAASK
jgi:hypothetical protein